jgi:hypothetical protein
VSLAELNWSEDIGGEYIQFPPKGKQKFSSGNDEKGQNRAKNY